MSIMIKKTRSQKGLTLLEVLVSVSVFFLIWMAAAASIVGSRYLSSFAKHKGQAIYLAQEALEEQRRRTFNNIASRADAVPLDTQGTFNTATDDLNGNRVITVTAVPGDAFRKRVRADVTWWEPILGGRIQIHTYCTTDIANETNLN